MNPSSTDRLKRVELNAPIAQSGWRSPIIVSLASGLWSGWNRRLCRASRRVVGSRIQAMSILFSRLLCGKWSRNGSFLITGTRMRSTPRWITRRKKPTLVEFRLTPTAGGGTLLVVTETGFDKIPGGTAATKHSAWMMAAGRNR